MFIVDLCKIKVWPPCYILNKSDVRIFWFLTVDKRNANNAPIYTGFVHIILQYQKNSKRLKQLYFLDLGYNFVIGYNYV